MRPGKKLLIGALVVGITVLHSVTTMADIPLHEFYRELYFIPAILAGFWGGRRAGLTTSVAISVLFLPHVVHSMGTTTATLLINAFEIGLFNLAGLLSGTYHDAKSGYADTLRKPYHPVPVERNFLLYADGTSASLYAANYLARVFGKVPGVGVTVFWPFKPADSDFFGSAEEATAQNMKEYRHEEQVSVQLREILIAGGIPETSVQMKKVTIDGKLSPSDVIPSEIRAGSYDTVVIGKHPRTKSQEFLIGSTTVKLVREGVANIIAVKVPGETKQGA